MKTIPVDSRHELRHLLPKHAPDYLRQGLEQKRFLLKGVFEDCNVYPILYSDWKPKNLNP